MAAQLLSIGIPAVVFGVLILCFAGALRQYLAPRMVRFAGVLLLVGGALFLTAGIAVLAGALHAVGSRRARTRRPQHTGA